MHSTQKEEQLLIKDDDSLWEKEHFRIHREQELANLVDFFFDDELSENEEPKRAEIEQKVFGPTKIQKMLVQKRNTMNKNRNNHQREKIVKRRECFIACYDPIRGKLLGQSMTKKQFMNKRKGHLHTAWSKKTASIQIKRNHDANINKKRRLVAIDRKMINQMVKGRRFRLVLVEDQGEIVQFAANKKCLMLSECNIYIF